MSKRPEYARIRRFLAKGGVLQRERVYEAPIRLSEAAPGHIEMGRPAEQVVWHAAARDGRFFHAQTCEWLRHRPSFKLDGEAWRLVENPTHPGVYKLEAADETQADDTGQGAQDEGPEHEPDPGAPAARA